MCRALLGRPMLILVLAIGLGECGEVSRLGTGPPQQLDSPCSANPFMSQNLGGHVRQTEAQRPSRTILEFEDDALDFIGVQKVFSSATAGEDQ